MKNKTAKFKIAVVFIITLLLVCFIKTNNVYSTDYFKDDIRYTIIVNDANNTVTIKGIHPTSESSGDIIIPTTMTVGGKQYTVNAIEMEEVNEGIGEITTIVIPSTVNKIDNMKIVDVKGTISVESSNLVYSSQDGVLFNKDKTKLIRCPIGFTEEYTIPDSVRTIGEGAFYNCKSVKKIVMPDSVTSIENEAFYSSGMFKSLSMSNNLQTIGQNAFFGVFLDESISLPESLQTIGDEAFYNAQIFSDTINIPERVTSIGKNAFKKTYVKEINVSSSNRNYSSVDGIVFNKEKTELIICPEQKEGAYTLPETVTKIADEAFSRSKITHITLSENIQQIGEGAFIDSHLYIIEMPGNTRIKNIEDNTFYNCRYLYEVVLPESIETIGKSAFERCGTLSSVEIQKNIKSIDSTAFSGYTGIIIGYKGTVAEQYAKSNNITFIAKKLPKYTVKFIVEGTETIVEVEEGNAATAPQVQERLGYTFLWDRDFSNITSDITVNGRYTPKTDTPYIIEHYKQDTNLNTYTKEVENRTGITGTTAQAIAKENYTGFKENTTHPQRVQSGTIAGDGSLTLKLYYDRMDYTVTLNANGGNISSGEINSYKYGIEKTLPINVTKTGHTFGGWYENSNCTGTAVTKISNTETGNKTYYAKWTVQTYTVTLNKNGGTVNEGDVTSYTYGTEKTLPTNVTKTGHTFGGWYENSNCTGTAVTKISNTETGNKTYYAKWTVQTYTVTLNKNGGTVNEGDVTSYTYGTEKTLPTDVTKTGYTFGGWYENSNCTGTAVTKITETDTGAKTYYAKWIKEAEEPGIVTSDKYKIDEETKTITKVIPNLTPQTFMNNINIKGDSTILNSKGQVLKNTDLVGTGCKLQIDNNGVKTEYEIAVRGDIDGNGKITATDLSTLNQAIIKKIKLTGIREKAADIDCNGRITATDLSTLNQVIIKKIQLTH